MKRRRKPEHSWDRLKGTQLNVVPLAAGTVRQLSVNVEDPMPSIVSFGRHALTHEAHGHTLRFLTVDNFNNDPRELAAVAVEPFAPEAARRIAAGRPQNGWHWGVFVASNGTTLAELDPPRMEAAT